MARIRTIKPEFCTSQDTGALSRDARLFFLQLLTECDDEGRMLWIPRRLCGVLYPHDEEVTAAMLQSWCDECSARNMVFLYDTDQGRALQVVNWSKHQKISHATPSRIQPPQEPSREIPEKLRKSSGETLEVLRPDLGTGNREQGTGKRKSSAAASESPTGFDEFWQAYPRKSAKPDAMRAFRRLAPDTKALVAILAGIQRDRRSDQWLRDGGKFIPHPATYLNQRRWEDQEPERLNGAHAARSSDDDMPTLRLDQP